jgi:hypothetical protein
MEELSKIPPLKPGVENKKTLKLLKTPSSTELNLILKLNWVFSKDQVMDQARKACLLKVTNIDLIIQSN